VSEIPVDPETLAYLGARFGYVNGSPLPYELTYLERMDGWDRAERIIRAWAKTGEERAFLRALAAGNEIAEARRISGLTRSRADALLRRIRGDREESHKQV
jgi:hypothetical protein